MTHECPLVRASVSGANHNAPGKRFHHWLRDCLHLARAGYRSAHPRYVLAEKNKEVGWVERSETHH
jgi:hypothetical protein